MKTAFLTIALFISFSCLAQKKDLEKLNSNLYEILHSTEGMHLEYALTVNGKGTDPETETINIALYKRSNDIFKMVMGDVQTLFRYQKLMLKVNHLEKLIVLEEDADPETDDDHTMLSQLKTLVDSAKQVNFSKEKDELVYDLDFASPFVYKRIQIKFSAKTKLPSSLYAEYDPDNKEPYHSISVDYKIWDLKWTDKENELAIDRFVEMKNNRYEPVAGLSNYKMFKTETGPINIDFK